MKWSYLKYLPGIVLMAGTALAGHHLLPKLCFGDGVIYALFGWDDLLMLLGGAAVSWMQGQGSGDQTVTTINKQSPFYELFANLQESMSKMTGEETTESTQKTTGTTTGTTTGVSTVALPEETGREADLAASISALADQAIQLAQEPMPEGLSLADIASGKLPEESMERIQQVAFGGLGEAGRRATRFSQERALAQGVPLSSYQGVMEAEAIRPAMEQATRTSAAMQQQELGRLGNLRQQTLANMIAVQQSPALDRLTRLRMAQPTTTQAGTTEQTMTSESFMESISTMIKEMSSWMQSMGFKAFEPGSLFGNKEETPAGNMPGDDPYYFGPPREEPDPNTKTRIR